MNSSASSATSSTKRPSPHELSGGTRQKLNLTLALLHDPDVLLLDEPYQGFDWETYLRFWDLVEDLRARGKAIVVITHLVFEQDRFDLLADLTDGLPPRVRRRGRTTMSVPDALRLRPLYGQFPTALRFCVRDQTRNRLAALLLVLFVPAWYLMMAALAGHTPLDFKLYATGRVLHVDGGHLTLISAGLNSVTMIAGFVVFDAVRKALAFDRRLVFAGYRQSTLIGAKSLAVALVAGAIALYTALAMLPFWRPDPGGWFAVLMRLHRHRTHLRHARPAPRRPGQARPGRLLPDHHGRADGHLSAEPAGQPARQQARPAMVSLLRAHAVRRRRLLREYRAVGPPRARPELGGRICRDRAGDLPDQDPQPHAHRWLRGDVLPPQ